MEKEEAMIMPGQLNSAEQKTIYKTGSLIFVLKTYLPKAKKSLTQMTPDMNKSGVIRQGKNAIIFKVSDGNTTKTIHVLSSENQSSQPASCMLNGVKVTVDYGMLKRKLPFSITLR